MSRATYYECLSCGEHDPGIGCCSNPDVQPVETGVPGKELTTKIDFALMPAARQGEFLKDLSKHQLRDLSETIRNTHVSSLMQHDMDTWAQIADKVEMHRDILADKLKEAERLCYVVLADMQTERAAKRAWRLAAALLGVAWALAAVVVWL